MQRVPNHLSCLAKIAVLTMVATCAACYPESVQFGVRDIHHTSWTSENGVGAVFEIQQDREGYLWLTTANGVVKFDGVSFQSLESATNSAVHSYDISSVFLAPSGRIWFTTRTSGLVLFEAGKAVEYPFDRRCISTAANGGMVEDSDGSLWVKALSGLYHLKDHSCEQIVERDGYPGGLPAALLVDRNGTVWVKAPSGSLLFRQKGQRRFELFRHVCGPSAIPAFMHQGPNGTIWLSDDCGLRQLPIDEKDSAIPLPKTETPSLQTGDFGFASDGSLWAVVGYRVLRFEHQPWIAGQIVEASRNKATAADQLPSSAIWNLKIDAEGSVWIGTNSGLDRLRNTAFKSVVLPGGEQHEFALAAGDQGDLWVGNASTPLMRVDADGHASVMERSHIAGCIRRDHNGIIWSADDGAAKLWKSSPNGFLPVHYPEEDTARVVSLAVDRNSEPWINIRPGRTYHLSHGTWKNENDAIGKRIGLLGAMAEDDHGILWLSFANDLIRWDGNSYEKFSFPLGRLDISVATMAARGNHVWLAGAGGIVLFTEGKFFLMEFADPQLPGRVSGIVETKSGELWTNGFSGITHVSAPELARWARDPMSKAQGEHLDAFDGLPGLSAERFPEPSLIEASDGKMWFATTKGIAWLDREALSRIRNSVPPPVYITSIVANGRTFAALPGTRLPKLNQNLAITYTALSLAVPERIRFRYKLDGVDKDWQEPGSRREAFYTKLSSGTYTFHVVACNNDGVWNLAGASLAFTVEPALYQTWWMRTASIVIAIALIAWMIRSRMLIMARNIHARLAERLDERERIARELHDTLLQGVLGASIQLDLAEEQLAENSPVRGLIHRVLENLRQVTEEGRMALRGLRTQDADSSDLAKALLRVRQEYPHKDKIAYRVLAQDNERTVRTEIRNEIYRIGREAIVNAYVHSEAAAIEVEILYTSTQLNLFVRDDGRGIDPVILRGGRDGHWGLSGMRERAQRIGATLKLRSRPGAGTEVELTVPGHIAFEDDQSKSTSRWLNWLRREGFGGTDEIATKARDEKNDRRA